MSELIKEIDKSSRKLKIVISENFPNSIRNSKNGIYYDSKEPCKPMNIILIDTRYLEFECNRLSYPVSKIIKFPLTNFSLSFYYDPDNRKHVINISFGGITIDDTVKVTYILNDDDLEPFLHLNLKDDTIFITLSNSITNSHMYLIESKTIENGF